MDVDTGQLAGKSMARPNFHSFHGYNLQLMMREDQANYLTE